MKTKCISNLSTFVAVAVLSFACLTALAQDYRILHHFAGGNNDGARPWGDLIQSGTNLYGMTEQGGSNNLGTVFKVNSDGTNFQVLHSFIGGANDGQNPWGSLIQSGSTLYGMAASSDTSYGGIVFQINTDADGSGFLVMHKFAVSDGMWPYGSLIQSDDTLYGMTTAGGAGSGWDGYGTVFSLNTNGPVFNFTVLHTFNVAANDGGWPYGALFQSGASLYGTTAGGGSGGYGTVFQIGTNGGTNYHILYQFTGDNSGGTYPNCSLVHSGSTLYGMTEQGGSNNYGTVFKVNTDGTFQQLHSFTGSTNDGRSPEAGTLAQRGTMLYGMTWSGGVNGTNGVVYQINTNGVFQLLHRFAGGSSDGKQPGGSVLLSGSTLYGMTGHGGSNNLGVIFALDLFPKLAVTLNGTNLILSWSTNYPAFVLEGADQLDGTWTTVSGVTGCSATLPVGADSRFYRLRK